MAGLTGVDDRCSIARSLEVLGERWSLLVLREALQGRTRFSEFRARLGVAPDVLSARLATLVEHGVLEKRPYREPGARERVEYLPTEAGRDLIPVLAAFAAWGDAHVPTGYGPAVRYVDASSGRELHVAFVDADGTETPRDAVTVVPGPGARAD